MQTKIRFVRVLVFCLVLIFPIIVLGGTSATSLKTNVKSTFPYKNTVSFKVHIAPELTPITALSVKLKTVDNVKDVDGTRIIQFTDSRIRIVPEGNPLLDLDPDRMKVVLQTYTTVFTDMQKLKNGSLIAVANGKHSDSLAVTLAEELGKNGIDTPDLEILDKQPMLDLYGMYDLMVDDNMLMDASVLVEQMEQEKAEWFEMMSHSGSSSEAGGTFLDGYWYSYTYENDDGSSTTTTWTTTHNVSADTVTHTKTTTTTDENGNKTSESKESTTEEDDDNDSLWDDFWDWLTGNDITYESEGGRGHHFLTNMLLNTMFNVDTIKKLQPLITSAYESTAGKTTFVTAANKVLKTSATTLNTKLQNKARVTFKITNIQ